MEREKGFEPSTLALARRCSTTELFPLTEVSLHIRGAGFYWADEGLSSNHDRYQHMEQRKVDGHYEIVTLTHSATIR
jgi:hypothetical protein